MAMSHDGQVRVITELASITCQAHEAETRKISDIAPRLPGLRSFRYTGSVYPSLAAAAVRVNRAPGMPVCIRLPGHGVSPLYIDHEFGITVA